jgi:hypothetical protein
MMKVWPFGAALRRVVSSRLMLRWLKTVVVSDEEKALLRRQAGTGKTSESESLLTCRNLLDDIRTRAGIRSWDKSGGWSAYWPGGVRHIDDVSPVCGICVEQEKACPDAARPGRVGRKGVSRAADTVRDRVPMRGAPADRPVVVVKPL